MLKEEQVVITGIGLVSPLGCDYNEVWASLLAGKNGISTLKGTYESLKAYQIYVGGIAPDICLNEFNLDRQSKAKLKNINKTARMLVYSGLKAMEDAGLQPQQDTEKYDIGAIIGCGATFAEDYDEIPRDERNPKWFFEIYPNLMLSYLSIAASIKGYGNTIVAACVGGSNAIGEAFKRIQRGEDKILLAGGVDNKLSALHASGFSRLNMTSTSKEPDGAVRPFDKDRSGLVIGQGACVLVLEALSNAKARGADIKGYIAGYGCALDGVSVADACSQGKTAAMQRAIKDAGLLPDDIKYINAHGTSTISNDKEESIAIKGVFGSTAYSIPISSSKSMLGHTFAACGAIEAFICLKSLESQKVHINRNFVAGDEFCNLDYVTDSPRAVKMDYCLSNTSGLGGYNSTLVFAKV